MMSGRTLAALPVIFLLTLCVSTARGEERRLRGVVTTSDGSSAAGFIRLAGNRPLRVWDDEKKRFYKVPLDQVRRVVVHVVSEGYEDEFRFKEESSREKVLSGKRFPRRDLLTEVHLKNGTIYAGLVEGTTVYVETKDARKRFILRKKQRGTTEQTLDDLAYVTGIDLGVSEKNAKPDTPREPRMTLEGRLKVTGKLLAVKAMRHGTADVFEATLRDGGFILRGLPEGVYDLFVETDERLYGALGMAGEKPGAGELSEEERGAVDERIGEIPDFFPDRRVVWLAGSSTRIKALVRYSREKKSTSFAKKTQEIFRFRRFEVCVLHREAGRWIVDQRRFIARDRADGVTGARPLARIQELADLPVKKGGASRLDLDLAALEPPDLDEHRFDELVEPEDEEEEAADSGE